LNERQLWFTCGLSPGFVTPGFGSSLLEGLADYVINGHGDVERLQDVDPSELRLRIGDYRIRFYYREEAIVILRVLHRKEAYR